MNSPSRVVSAAGLRQQQSSTLWICIAVAVAVLYLAISPPSSKAVTASLQNPSPLRQPLVQTHRLQPPVQQLAPQEQQPAEPQQFKAGGLQQPAREEIRESVAYWDALEPTDVSVAVFEDDSTDVIDSRRFLHKVLGAALEESKAGKRKLVALDVAAGVGRVSERVLLPLFQEVDVMEPSGTMINKAKERLGAGSGKLWPAEHQVGRFFQVPAQDFQPEPNRYDVIWGQWVILFMRDDDAIAFLKRCAAALKPGGFLFLKENIDTEHDTKWHPKEKDISRSRAAVLRLVEAAGLQVVGMSQVSLGAEYMPVESFALVPKRGDQ